MSRRQRLVFERSYYHVFTRGNDRKRIFRKEADYQVFLSIIRKYLEKFQISITNYCLMPNHLHLLIFIETGGELSKFMKAVLQVYANYHRKEYGSTGFLYQNRFKSLLIKEESYLIECARYIERNPLRAKLVSDIFAWPWSSLSYYAKGIKDGIITKVNPIFEALADTPVERREAYIKYVLQERAYEQILDKEFDIK
ncbi:MAG: transposase [Candidatus Omnitrophota bacterium]|nr:transposase [Candidatus Omnitrophota bacterium]